MYLKIYIHRYGGWSFGQPLPTSLQMDLLEVPKNRTLSKVNNVVPVPKTSKQTFSFCYS